ncbi:protein of unknown function DUF86 [Caldicellulosiruptor saccharolyticus DSM 8903]|uniref:DUF86 domain-containing protein n=1 Tax=Caldicellulosiruptor saccharolyticus (strain ATCC 43494 / DSM 8903 / Tp8T 6331) TaxID=351627 RepID=A4XGW7_CALS8|nr:MULTISPECIES: HepT-like ribonuclease domain-containing protein [Caldicellulosiruptor]ABP66152.1 protein of unknown function DUF86 [Caldicellulosiruptor saccharolyticus DSM 8903]
MLEHQNKLSILKRVNFIYLEIEDLEQYKNSTFEEYRKDRFIRRNVERIIENIANAIIDILKIIIANSDVQVPDFYREMILKLSEFNIIDIALATSIAEVARLHNILAHQYLDIRWEYLKNFIDEK